MKFGDKLNTEAQRRVGFLLATETGGRTTGTRKATTSPRKAMCLSASVFCLSVFLCLFSCDRRELTYYMESELIIEADWSQSGLSDKEQQYGATAVFFPQDGGEPKAVLMGDRTRQKVRLPAGIYDIVLFNRSFDDFGAVTFEGNTFDTFHARARQVETRVNPETRATTRVIVRTPEEVATDTYIGFEVTEAMLGNYSQEAMARMQTRTQGDTRAEETDPDRYIIRLVPRKITCRVNVTVYIRGLHNVNYAIGTADGVSEGVSLCNGALPGNTVTQQFGLSDIVFDEGSPFDGVMTGTFNVFGMECSDTRKLNLTFYLTDGETVVSNEFDTRVTQDEHPDDNTLEYHIELTPPKLPDVKPTDGEDAGFDLDVDDWGTPQDVEVPMGD